MCKSVKVIPFSEYKKLAKLFQEALAHLEYCGYGDSYERECAREDKLPERLERMEKRINKILEMNEEKLDLDDGLDDAVVGSLP